MNSRIGEGKQILVTGATGGIGRILCEHLGKNGYSLVLSARDSEKLNDLKLHLERVHKTPSSVLVCDFASGDSVQDAARRLKSETERLDGCVLMPPQLPSTGECLPAAENWEKLFRTSFVQPLELLKGIIPHLELTSGRCVLISGISSAQVLSHYATSNVLRTAWVGQMKTLAFAYGSKGVRFNTVSLGGIMTDKYVAGIKSRASEASVSYDEQLANETDNVPLAKYGTPEEVAVAVETLLGPFSDHITGVNITCDGGFTRAY